MKHFSDEREAEPAQPDPSDASTEHNRREIIELAIAFVIVALIWYALPDQVEGLWMWITGMLHKLSGLG